MKKSNKNRLDKNLDALFDLPKFDKVKIKNDSIVFMLPGSKKTRISYGKDQGLKDEILDILLKRADGFSKVEEYEDSYKVCALLLQLEPNNKEAQSLDDLSRKELHAKTYKAAFKKFDKAKTTESMVDCMELAFKSLEYSPRGQYFKDAEDMITIGLRQLDNKLRDASSKDVKDIRYITKLAVKYYKQKKNSVVSEATQVYDKAILKSVTYALNIKNSLFNFNHLDAKEIKDKVIKESVDALNSHLETGRVKDTRLYEALIYFRRLSEGLVSYVTQTIVLIYHIIIDKKIQIKLRHDDEPFLKNGVDYLRKLIKIPNIVPETIEEKLTKILDKLCYYDEINAFMLEKEVLKYIKNLPIGQKENIIADALFNFLFKVDKHNFWALETRLIRKSNTITRDLKPQNLDALESLFEECKSFVERSPDSEEVSEIMNGIKLFFEKNTDSLDNKRNWKSSFLQDKMNTGKMNKIDESRKETVFQSLSNKELPNIEVLRATCRNSDNKPLKEVYKIILPKLNAIEAQEYLLKLVEVDDSPEIKPLKIEALNVLGNTLLQKNGGKLSYEIINIWNKILTIDQNEEQALKNYKNQIAENYSCNVVVMGSLKSGKSSIVGRCLLETLKQDEKLQLKEILVEDIRKAVKLNWQQLESKKDENLDRYYTYCDEEEFIFDKTISSNTLFMKHKNKNILMIDTSSNPSGLFDLYTDISRADIIFYVVSIDETKETINGNPNFKETMRALAHMRHNDMKNIYMVCNMVDKDPNKPFKKNISPPLDQYIADQLQWIPVSAITKKNIAESDGKSKSLLQIVSDFVPSISFTPHIRIIITDPLTQNHMTKQEKGKKSKGHYLKDAYVLVESGVLKENDTYKLLPFEKDVQVKKIIGFDKDENLAYALPGSRVIICLEMKENHELYQGHLLCLGNKFSASRKISVSFEISSYFDNEDYVKYYGGKNVVFSVGLECSLMYKGFSIQVIVKEIHEEKNEKKSKKITLLKEKNKVNLILESIHGQVCLQKGSPFFLFKKYHYLGTGEVLEQF